MLTTAIEPGQPTPPLPPADAATHHAGAWLRVLGVGLLLFLLGVLHGLPPVVGAVLGSGLDVMLAQAVIGVIGLLVLWRRWREAVRRETGSTEAAGLLRTAAPGSTSPAPAAP